MEINLSQAPEQNLIDLVNYTAGTALTLDDVDITTIAELPIGEQTSEVNTAATITGKANSRYSGSIEIRYNRIDLQTLYDAIGGDIKVGTGADEAEVLTALEAKIGIASGQVEIVSGTIEDQSALEVTPVGPGILYRGSLNFNLSVQRNLGPGPVELVGGDEQAGFYGEITSGDFIAGGLMASYAGLTTGSNINSNTSWLKFAYEGKVLYIPKYNTRSGVSWEDLYEAGVIYGTDDTGHFPVGGGTNQRTVISFDDNEYIVRTLSMAATDPAGVGVTSGGELGDLLLALTNGNFNASYSEPDIGFDTQYQTAWGQETVNTNADMALFSGYESINSVYARTKDDGGAIRCWRPVLELVG